MRPLLRGAVIATVCFIVCWQLSSVLLPGVATVASGARWAWSKLVFRYERRWRSEAINAFRSLPELAALGPAELGVIAGRLHRYSSRSVTSLTDVSGHLYVRRGAPANGLNGWITRRGRVVVADEATTRTLATKHDVVVLPTGWQAYVSCTVSVAQNS